MKIWHFKTVKYSVANSTFHASRLSKLLASLVFLGGANVCALEFSKDFFLPAAVDFDTNLEMRDKNEKSIWRYTATPRVRLRAEEDVNAYFVDGALRLQRSSDKNRSEDREDPLFDAGWTRTYSKGQVSLLGHYEKNSSRFTELTRSGLVSSDGSAINRSLNLNLTHNFSDKLVFTSGLGYATSRYIGISLNDFDSKSLSGRLSYQYSDYFMPFVQLGLGKFNSKDRNSGDSNSRSYSVGANFIASPDFTYNVAIGANKISSRGTGWIANAGLNYIFSPTSQLVATYSRNVSPSGLGNFQVSDDISLGYSAAVTERSSVGTDFTWSKNRSINDADAKQLVGWYSRELTQDWSVRAALQLRQLDSNNSSASGEQASISLIYNKLKF